MTIFIPGALMNPKNVSSMGVWKHRRYMKNWRERTAQYLLKASLAFPSRRWPWPPEAPKTVTFTAHTAQEWDDDGLAFSLVSVRDALKDMQLIDDDAPRAGHTFVYRQVIDRKHRGVEIAVVPSPTFGGQPISWSTLKRISKDGP